MVRVVDVGSTRAIECNAYAIEMSSRFGEWSKGCAAAAAAFLCFVWYFLSSEAFRGTGRCVDE